MPMAKDPEEWAWSEILEHAKKAAAGHIPADDPRIQEWLSSRPPQIRELALRYPDHQVYRVKKGAPYTGTHPGCIGVVMAYTEDTEGAIGCFSVKFAMLRAAADGDYLPIYAHIDPEWLEAVSMEEIEKNAAMEVN